MEKVLISVIVPVYNRADTIRRAINGILQQTYQNLEVIIIDDASKDFTDKVIASIDDARIRYVRNENQQGANISRNIGLGYALGRIIAFCDSADIWMADKLEKQLAQLKNENADIVFCAEKVFVKDTSYILPFATQKAFIEQGRLAEQLAIENCVDTSTLFVKRKCFEEVGKFNLELPRLQEYEWMIRAVQKCKVSYLDEVLVHAFIRDDSITSDISKLLKAVPVLYREHANFFASYQKQFDLLLSPVKQLNLKNASYDDYEKYFQLLEETVSGFYEKDAIQFYQEVARFFVEKDYIRNFIADEAQKKHTFLRLLENQEQEFYLFGAGEAARKLYSFLKGKFMEHAIKAIIVSSTKNNSKADFQVPMFEILQCDEKIKQKPVILAVSKNAVYDVVCRLRRNGFTYIICLTDQEWQIVEG